MTEQAIVNMMNQLGCSREDAIQIIADDEAIDRGEEMDFDLPPEKQKVVKEMTKTGTRKSGEKVERKRKPNEDKRAIMNALLSTMENWHHDEESPVAEASGFTLTNIERQIDFILNGVQYSVTLTAHRAPKDKGKA